MGPTGFIVKPQCSKLECFAKSIFYGTDPWSVNYECEGSIAVALGTVFTTLHLLLHLRMASGAVFTTLSILHNL